MATSTSNGRVTTVTQPSTSISVLDRRRSTTRSAVDPTTEIGTSGLRQYGGFVLEEWLAQLQGKRGAWVYREMQDNSAIVGGILYAIEMLARDCEWRVEGSDEKMPRGGMLATEFVESCMHDMSHTWGDFVSEVLSFLPYGWALHEEVYKKRQGEVPEPPIDEEQTTRSEIEEPSHPASSAYDDGLIGWRKLPVRAQETLLRWGFTGYSSVRYMEQIDWHGGDHRIPIEKSLLFRTKALRGNPEGRSILRNAYQAYYYIQNIQNIEAIGIERDLAGLPMVTPPEHVDLYHEANKDLLHRVQEMVGNVRRDENEGIVLPSAGWTFELLSTGGARQTNTDDILRRYRQELAASMLADFFLVGLDGLGSYAMVDVKSDLFSLSMNSTLDIVCEIMSRHAIPRLMKLNGATLKEMPRINHSNAGRVDIERVGQFLYQLQSAGANIPWSPQMVAQLLAGAGLPANFSGEDTRSEDVAGAKEYEEEQQARKDAEKAGHEQAQEPPEPRQLGGEDRGGRLKTEDQRGPFKKTVEQLRKDYAEGRIELEEFESEVGKALAPVVPVTDKLRQRHMLLAQQLEAEVQGALRHLGEKAATSYLSHAEKGDQQAKNVVSRVVRSLSLPDWADGHLGLILRNHAARVAEDTQRTLQTEVGPEMRLDVKAEGTNLEKSEGEFNAADIAPQVRASIMKAIEDGRRRGESSVKIARRIRDYVPAGRFTKAGSKYRAELIARNETARLQRDSILTAYENNHDVTHVRIRDGVYGPPRSDLQCMERDGQIVPIGDARAVIPYHPLCTLSFDPIIG